MVNSAETRVSAEFTIQIGGRLSDRVACAIGAGRILPICTTGYFKTQVILKQPFTIEKGYYVTNSTKKYCSTPYLLSRIALRLLKIIEPYYRT